MRIELRSPDVACNPYLAFAVLLHAGLEGIERQYKAVPPTESSPEQLSDSARRRKGIRQLPDSLNEAIRLAEQSELVRRALGPHIHAKLIENKRMEWRKFAEHVTDYELDRYLPLL